MLQLSQTHSKHSTVEYTAGIWTLVESFSLGTGLAGLGVPVLHSCSCSSVSAVVVAVCRWLPGSERKEVPLSLRPSLHWHANQSKCPPRHCLLIGAEQRHPELTTSFHFHLLMLLLFLLPFLLILFLSLSLLPSPSFLPSLSPSLPLPLGSLS